MIDEEKGAQDEIARLLSIIAERDEAIMLLKAEREALCAALKSATDLAEEQRLAVVTMSEERDRAQNKVVFLEHRIAQIGAHA